MGYDSGFGQNCQSVYLAPLQSILNPLIKNDDKSLTYFNRMLLHNQRPDGSDKYTSGRQNKQCCNCYTSSARKRKALMHISGLAEKVCSSACYKRDICVVYNTYSMPTKTKTKTKKNNNRFCQGLLKSEKTIKGNHDVFFRDNYW